MLPAKIVLQPPQSPPQSPKHSNRLMDSDFSFYIQNQILPAIRSRLHLCSIVAALPPKSKVLLISQNLPINMFAKVVELLHGMPLEIANMKDLQSFIDVADYLRAEELLQEVQMHIEKDVQSYEIFCLLEMAYKFGLQKIFSLCISYLEFDGFEQIKYNKFDFLECNFTLFQIILRRHHLLKIRGKIQGLQSSDIEEVIYMYCKRKKLENYFRERLLQKYVYSIDRIKIVKNSLRLQKLAHKNIMQSANIETQVCESSKMQDDFNNIVMNSGQKSASVRLGKYSTEWKKDSTPIHTINFADESVNFGIQESSELTVDEIKQNQYEINIKNVLMSQKIEQQSILSSQKRPRSKTTIPLNLQQPEIMASKISCLLNQYEQAFKIHESNFENMRKNAKSSQYTQSKSSICYANGQYERSSKLCKASNPNLTFTIYLPQQQQVGL